MSYGSIEYYRERIDYWHQESSKARKTAEAAIAEAKKSKERELTAIRVMLKFKATSLKAWSALAKIRVLYETAETQSDFNHGIYEVLKELNNDGPR